MKTLIITGFALLALIFAAPAQAKHVNQNHPPASSYNDTGSYDENTDIWDDNQFQDFKPGPGTYPVESSGYDHAGSYGPNAVSTDNADYAVGAE